MIRYFSCRGKVGRLFLCQFSLAYASQSVLSWCLPIHGMSWSLMKVILMSRNCESILQIWAMSHVSVFLNHTKSHSMWWDQWEDCCLSFLWLPLSALVCIRTWCWYILVENGGRSSGVSPWRSLLSSLCLHIGVPCLRAAPSTCWCWLFCLPLPVSLGHSSWDTLPKSTGSTQLPTGQGPGIFEELLTRQPRFQTPYREDYNLNPSLISRMELKHSPLIQKMKKVVHTPVDWGTQRSSLPALAQMRMENLPFHSLALSLP